MYRRARQRATSSGLEFNLEKSDVIIPEFCPILGLRLEVHKGSPGGRPASPALDRKDPTKGYTKENIWVVSHLANMMKSNASKDQLKLFASWINSQDW
jgi:hypothetical protein